MNSIPVFYYFLTNCITGEEKIQMCFNYLGDVNDIVGEWLITDWTMEMEDWA